MHVCHIFHRVLSHIYNFILVCIQSGSSTKAVDSEHYQPSSVYYITNLFGLFYLLHAQRTRLPLPFIDSSPFISKSFNFSCICWAKNKIPQWWNCLLLDLWSNITGLTPVGKAFIWMSFKQNPSSHSAHSEVFSWRQVCPGHVDGQKTQILSVICPPSVPHALASTHYALTMSQSLQTLGEHSCAFVKVLWSFCRPASFIFSFTDSSVNLFAHAVSFFRMHINIP